MAWNMFNAAPSNWTRTIMLRWPLDSLTACAGFTYNYYWTNAWFTFVPVQGADHVMYWASNYPQSSPSNRIAIWTWPENTGTNGISSVVRTVRSLELHRPRPGDLRQQQRQLGGPHRRPATDRRSL